MYKKGGKICLGLAVLLLSGFFCIQKVKAQTEIIFSEICWMGSVESANDEWIELYNNSSEDIDLTGWMIKAQDGSPEISLEGIISAGGYFLLERTDDDSALGVKADFIYSGSLGNTGEVLELFDDDNNLVDSIDAVDVWPAGDNESKQTMVLVDGVWQTSDDVGGSPKAINQLRIKNEELENDRSDLEGGDDEEVKIVKKEGRIVINEIYPNPVGSDREREFIELYNAGESVVDLDGWRLEVDGKSYEFGKLDILYENQFGKSVEPGKCFVIFRNMSNLVLNNSGGEVKLFKPGKKTAEDILRYNKAPEGYSYANTSNIVLEKISTSTKKFFLNSSQVGDWVWTSQISPGQNNQIKTINTAPKVLFSAPDKIEVKKEIYFDASDTVDEDGDDLEFVWNFGDGVEVKQEEVSHTFLNPGEYKVVLKVKDDLEESVFSKLIMVSGDGQDFLEKDSPISEDEYAWYEDLENIFYSPSETKNVETKNLSISIKEAKEIKGKEVEITGQAVVLPGVLGTQFFYIADEQAGVKVYNYKKEFPDFLLGDFLKIKGEMVDLRDEITLKVLGRSDIEIVEEGGILKALKINSEELSVKDVGRLFEIEGVIVKKDLPRVYLKDSFGEIAIYIKDNANISAKILEKEKNMKIIGVLGIVSGDLFLMPRNEGDVKVILEEVEENDGEVLGETENNTWELQQRNDKNNFGKYFLIILVVGVIIFLIYLYQKEKK